MKLLVAGSRTWTDRAEVDNYLNICNPDTLVVGDCPTGADIFAWEWAEARKRHRARHHALWQQEGRAAGPKRNERMFKYDRPDLVVCFRVNGPSPGTDDVIRRARTLGIPLEVIRQPSYAPSLLRPTQ